MPRGAAGVATEWVCRKYAKLSPDDTELTYDAFGNIVNPIVWEDPKIATGENFNVITDGGRTLLAKNLLSLSGSGFPLFFNYGASATAASHLDTRLTHELIADSTRPALTNSDSSALSSASTTTTTYTDTSYTPSYVYYVQTIVKGSVNGGSSLNVNQPIQEVGMNTSAACPGTPTGTSGIQFNHYVFGSATTLDSLTIFSATIYIHY